MHYLSENTKTLSTFNVENNLYLFDLYRDKISPLTINNILSGSYSIIENLVSKDNYQLYFHAFILHESIANNDLNSLIFIRRNKIKFDCDNDDASMGLFTSEKGLQQFYNKNPIEDTEHNSYSIQTFESGLAFSFPFADYGYDIEYIIFEEKIIGFRIQGISRHINKTL